MLKLLLVWGIKSSLLQGIIAMPRLTNRSQLLEATKRLQCLHNLITRELCWATC
jgi:hypothetical protein